MVLCEGLEQEVQEEVRFEWGKPDDALGEAAIHEDGFAPSDRICAIYASGHAEGARESRVTHLCARRGESPPSLGLN